MKEKFVITSTFEDGVAAYLANDPTSYLWCEEHGDVQFFEDVDQAKVLADEIVKNNGVPQGGRAPIVVKMSVTVVYVAEPEAA